MTVTDIPRRVARFVEPHGRHTRPYSPKRRNRFRSTPMERATGIHPLCRVPSDSFGRTGPIAVAHHAQRRHTTPLFAENTKSCLFGANGASRPTGGVLLAAHGRVRYTQTCRSICRAPWASHAALFAKKTKSTPVDTSGASHLQSFASLSTY